ncbi:MAG: hypothetical protein JWR15_1254 [Prosthecobacter sp.]|nr:hypothetical protein [Prosthecobacter sp.]
MSIRASSRPGTLRLITVVLALICTAAHAAEQLPEKPGRFFNDATGVVDRNVADQLNERLADYERESSNQLLVAFYPRMVTDSSLEDYCTRTFEKWGVGGAKRDNGAVLFVFTEQNKMRIQTGYGLEASLTDAECFRIMEGIKPFFRARDYTGGASFAVDSMIEATKGEYQGTGKTLAENDSDPQLWIALGFFAIMIGLRIYQARKRGYIYDSKGRRHLAGGGRWYDSGWSGGAGFGGGGGGGGSTFSGGGGSTGGGGASGGW